MTGASAIHAVTPSEMYGWGDTLGHRPCAAWSVKPPKASAQLPCVADLSGDATKDSLTWHHGAAYRKWRITLFDRTLNGIRTSRQNLRSSLLDTAHLAAIDVAIHPQRRRNAAMGHIPIGVEYDSRAFALCQCVLSPRRLSIRLPPDCRIGLRLMLLTVNVETKIVRIDCSSMPGLAAV